VCSSDLQEKKVFAWDLTADDPARTQVALDGRSALSSDGRWLLQDVRGERSSLPEAQLDAPVACLQQAMKGSSLPIEPWDGEAEQLDAHWSFPVPWPQTLDAVALRISTGGGGGGGCGGTEGPKPACYDCGYTPGTAGGTSSCVKVCTGYTNCREVESGCNMGPRSPLCATGSPFGNFGGGIIMY